MTFTPASSVEDIVAFLRTLRNETNIAGMGRYGIVTDTAIGIGNPVLQKLAKEAGVDHRRAMALWDTGIREARMLAIWTFDPRALSRDEVMRLADDFNSWEIVDTAADLLTETEFWQSLIAEFAAAEREFVRRTAFAMIAGASVHRKKEPDAIFVGYLPLIEAHATDPRNFVRKAVNWALRNIGKRNRTCHAPALALAEKLAGSTDKTARWIGKDAVRELTSEKTLKRLKP